MKRLAALLVAGLLAACAGPATGPGAADPAGSSGSATVQPDAVAAGLVCAIRPDGGPLLAERGIGGTGAPAGTTQIAERGIGGTGIAGTGIVGVITGFASICVNGLEVTYDNSAVVDINGTVASTAALRVGQVVMIAADGPTATPHARTISVRQDVAGRIESVELGSGTLRIAGLPVSVPAGTWGANRFGLGDWVAVSGLRRADGVIVASRLDAAPADVFTARGQVVQDGSVRRVGGLVLPEPTATKIADGQFVTVSGRYVGSRGQISAVTQDTQPSSPANYFGPSFKHLILQGFVRPADGGIWVDGLKIAAAPGMAASAGPDGLAVVSVERQPDGSFAAVAVRHADFRLHTGSVVHEHQRGAPGAAVVKSPAKGAAGRKAADEATASDTNSDDDQASPSTALTTLVPASPTQADVSAGLTLGSLPSVAARLSMPAPTTGQVITPAPIAAPTATPVPPALLAPPPPVMDSPTSGLMSNINRPATMPSNPAGNLSSVTQQVSVPGSVAGPTVNLVTTVVGPTTTGGAGLPAAGTIAATSTQRNSTTHARRATTH